MVHSIIHRDCIPTKPERGNFWISLIHSTGALRGEHLDSRMTSLASIRLLVIPCKQAPKMNQ